MRTSRTLFTSALATVTAVALFGGAVMAQEGSESDQQEDVAAGQDSGTEDLIDRLVDLSMDLEQALAIDVTFDAVTGEPLLDAVGASVTLEGASDQIRQLFIDADQTGGVTASAIGDVARGYLNIESAIAYLAEAEDYDLGRSLASVDDDGVATGADPAVGLHEVGFNLIEDAARRIHPALQVLRDATEADDAEQQYFESLGADYRAILDVNLPEIREAFSGRTTAVLVPVDRFDAGPGEARARSVEYTCIDRPSYPLAPAQEGVEVELGAPLGDPGEAADCPDLPRDETQPGAENIVTVAP